MRVVGEGGNLGLTQRGRVEYALAGGRVNTDAIDNSAGVDTSDHEVNIKIALNRVVDEGALDADGRARLLREMADEVAAAVLTDNHAQNATLAAEVASARSLLDAHERFMRALERSGRLDRAASRRCPTTGRWPSGAATGRRSPARSCRCCWPTPSCRPTPPCWLAAARRPGAGAAAGRLLPRAGCASASRRRSRGTRCAGRSSPPR